MEINDCIKELNILSDVAKNLEELIDMNVEIDIVTGDYFSVMIRVFPHHGIGGDAFCSECEGFDEAYSELNSMIVGARLAKGMEV